MSAGLVSVSFRKLCAEEIIDLCLKAGLSDIEWGGDVHCPAGDVKRAEYIRKITQNAGLRTVCYGSYYRAGEKDDFTPVINSAIALGSPLIRIWAGKTADADGEYRKAVEKDIKNAVITAGEKSVKISLECHRGTLTQNCDSAAELAEKTGCLLHFQPNPDITSGENDLYLQKILPYLSVFHVFAWDKGDVRLPLEERYGQWENIVKTAGKNVPYLLEFVKGDSKQQLISDACVLKGLLK